MRLTVVALATTLAIAAYTFWPEPKPLTYSDLDGEPVRAGKVVFLGDSLTYTLPASAVVIAPRKYGIGGRTTAGLLRDLATTDLSGVDLVVITIGTNDLVREQTAGIEARLRAISRGIRAPILWNAIPYHPNFDRDPVNAAIAKVCAERQDCTFLATDWRYPLDYNPDRMHLNVSGDVRWINAMRRTIRTPRPSRP